MARKSSDFEMLLISKWKKKYNREKSFSAREFAKKYLFQYRCISISSIKITLAVANADTFRWQFSIRIIRLSHVLMRGR